MGGCFSEEHHNVQVVTLNYSGILNSPFQFYCKESQEQQMAIGQIFSSLMASNELTAKPNFTWEIGQIDKKMQVGRYTPIYRKGAGVQKGRILSKDEFINKWEEQFQIQQKKIQSFECSERQKSMALMFDLMCMEALLMYAYKINSYEQAIDKPPQRYLKLSQAYFNRSFINEDIKLKKLIKYIQQSPLDILFLQETNDRLIKELLKMQKQGTFIIKDIPLNQSVIAVRTSLFKGKLENTQEMLNKISIDERKRMNWNNDTVIMFIGNVILISAHISSNKEKNKKQMQAVYRDMTTLALTYPKHKIILGCDANTAHFDDERITPQINDKFWVIPESEACVTSCKKRTSMQPQYHKAQVLASKRSDYIVTNAKLINQSVITIQNRKISSDSELLPSQEHPFDHFIVRAMLRLD